MEEGRGTAKNEENVQYSWGHVGRGLLVDVVHLGLIWATCCR